MLKTLLLPFEPIEDLSCCMKERCNFVAHSVRGLLSHYRTAHCADDSSFQSPCLYSKRCPHALPFRSYSGLYSHMRRNHPKFFQPSSNGFHENEYFGLQNSFNCIGVEDPQSTDFTEQFSSLQLVVDTSEQNDKNVKKQDVKELAGKFLLGVLGNEKLAEVHVDSIISRVEDLIQECAEQNTPGFKEESTALKHHDKSGSIFDGLRSKRGRIPYFISKFGLIPSTEINLPFNFYEDFRRHRQGHDQFFKQQSYQYIPILKQLEQILSVPDVYQEIFESAVEQSIPGYYCSFKDGSKYRNSEFFKKHPDALQIFLYLDEVQMCNPLGSKSLSRRKFVFVYFSLGNLPMRFRSGLQSIYLLSIFSAEQVSSFGINKLLRPIVEDLKKLEMGVEITIKSKAQTVFGTLVAIIADNLASHQLGGFKCGFSSSYRKCRTCLGTEEEIQCKYCHAGFYARTEEEHDQHCKLLTTEGLEQHYSKLYGINYESAFNELQHYHVIGGLPPDIMHDILEGILPLILAKMLNHYVLEKKLFKLKDLNHWIQNFDYGPNEIKNKPSVIQQQHLKKNNLRQSSSQIWCLAVILPLIIGCKVPPNCRRWSSLKDLLEISRIVFSERISYFDAFNLKSIINSFLQKLKNLKMRITAKMHNLVHYPHYIRLLGPLKNFWAMRYEAKHAFFKKITRVTNFNFINAPATLAERHQIWLTNKIVQSKGQLLKIKNEVPAATSSGANKASNSLKASTLPYGGQLCELLGNISMDFYVHSIPWVTANSNKIMVNKSFVLCPLKGATWFEFGRVRRILTAQGRILLACQLHRTKKFNNKYQAYEIIASEKFLVYDIESLNVTHVFYCHSASFSNCASLFIVTKQSLNSDLKIKRNNMMMH